MNSMIITALFIIGLASLVHTLETLQYHRLTIHALISAIKKETVFDELLVAARCIYHEQADIESVPVTFTSVTELGRSETILYKEKDRIRVELTVHRKDGKVLRRIEYLDR